MSWSISKTSKGSVVIVDEKGRNVCMFGWHWPIAVRTNAPLMAAAPEMKRELTEDLAFVREVIEMAGANSDGLAAKARKREAAIVAAIGKAEGRAADLGRPVPKHGSGP